MHRLRWPGLPTLNRTSSDAPSKKRLGNWFDGALRPRLRTVLGLNHVRRLTTPALLSTSSGEGQHKRQAVRVRCIDQDKGVVLALGALSVTHPWKDACSVLQRRFNRLLRARRRRVRSKSTAGRKTPEQLIDIFTFVYRENGVCLDAVQSDMCTKVNSDTPIAGCFAGRNQLEVEHLSTFRMKTRSLRE